MKSQKDAVVEQVKAHLPNFKPFVDKAIVVLTSSQLESIKAIIYRDLADGTIEYSKDKTNLAEVRAYARSLVMNHIKKAKELNGNLVPTVSSDPSTRTPRATMTKGPAIAPKGVDVSLLSEELKEYVKLLV
jgi:hypothetical protein